MKLLILGALFLVSCNPNTAEQYAKTPSDRMRFINTPSEPECDEGELGDLPGTELSRELGATLSIGSCNKKCSDNFEVLPKTSPRLGFLSFPIPGYLGVGRCRGHAIVTQKFNMLANFNEGENKEKCGPKNMSSICMTKYTQAIKDITEKNQVVNIPGFKSLAEFSAHPSIYPVLYRKVISYSSTYSAGFGHVEQASQNRDDNVFNEIYKRTNNRQLPYIGIKGGGITDHAILITSTKVIDGQRILCASDPNKRSYNPLEPDTCQDYIYIKNGNPTYYANGVHRTLSKFNILADEDFRTDKYVKARRDECIRNREASGECTSTVDNLTSKQ